VRTQSKSRGSKGATRVAQAKQPMDWTPILLWVKRLLLGASVVSLLAVATLFALQWVNKDVEKLRITAPLVHVTEEDIRLQLVNYFPASFFYLDVADVRDSLLAMPMVREASVKKQWPDTLMIELQEEVPVARWNQTEMLSHAGDVLPMSVQELSSDLDLPGLQGQPAQRQNVMRHYHLFTQWAKAFSLNWVGVEQSLAGWRLREKNGLNVWLDSENAMAGLKRLGGVLQKLNLQNVESIDLRYEQGFAVAWRPLMEQADKKENKS